MPGIPYREIGSKKAPAARVTMSPEEARKSDSDTDKPGSEIRPRLDELQIELEGLAATLEARREREENSQAPPTGTT